jgi:hypothetical protein
MAVVFEQGESFADLQKKNTIQNEDEDVGFFESALKVLKNGLMKLIHLMMKQKLELLEKLHKQ